MNVRDALGKAVASFQAGNFQQAEAVCRNVLKAQPDQPDALHLLGIVALQQGNQQSAVDLIEKALGGNPDNASYLSNLGEAYRGLGQLDQAVSTFERSLEIDPDRPEAHCGLGNALLAMGRRSEALARFEQAIRIDPRLAQAHYNKGNALSESGDFDGAAAAYRGAVAINPSFADANFNLGNALSAGGELVAAAAAYEAALKAAPYLTIAWHNLGNALRKLGRLEAARKAFSRAVELDASLAGAHLNIGTIAKLQGRLEAALDALDKAIGIEPDNALAHSERAHVLFLQGKLQEATVGYRRAIEIEPRFAWAHMGLSSALAHDGRLSEAREVSRTAVQHRRTYEWPFLGRQPIGRVLVLKGVENGHFEIGPGDTIRLLDAGLISIDEQFDRSKIQQLSFYVDGIEAGQERDLLPPCDLIFNAISDPDAMPRSQHVAERLVSAGSVPVINPPELVAQTRRDTVFEKLSGIDGLVCPKTVNLSETARDEGQIQSLLDDGGIEFPVIVRRAGTHVGESLEKKDSLASLWDYFSARKDGPFYIIQFFDYALESGEFVKMRVHIVDGVVYPNHLWFSDDWCIVRPERSVELMAANSWMNEMASDFLEDPEGYLGKQGLEALRSIHSVLPLDFFGVDFSKLPDGRILIFEANATMWLRPPAQETDPFRRPYLEAIRDALRRVMEGRILESRAG